MDLAITIVGLIVLSIPLAGLAAAAASGSSDLLSGLFRQNHDLGWPVGIQEEDLPPSFGGSPVSPPAAPGRDPAPSVVDAASSPAATSFRSSLRRRRLTAGSARR